MSPHTYITRMGGEEFLRLFEDHGHERSFWLDRGIDPEVAAVRPYEPWLKDDVEPVKRAHASLPSTGLKAAVTRKAKAEDGIIIHRHKVLPDLDPILPELRPKNPISTERPRRHWHGRGDPPEDDKYYEKHNPDAPDMIKHRWKAHTEPKGEMTPDKQAAMKRGEEAGNTEDVHATRSPGKYHMPPSGYIAVETPHDHDEFYKPPKFGPHVPGKYENYIVPWRRRARHVAKHHGGVDVSPGEHSHQWKKKDKDHAHGMRLDIHPWAEPLLDDAEIVYFGIEGCLKADSILSAIRREGRNESVFSVPSVGQWLAPELDDFAARSLRDKVVVIVPDADWIENPRVIEQAQMCRTYLHRQGVAAYVAAPPLKDGKVVHKGVDDYLGKGKGSLDNLMVQERRVDEAAQWAWLSGRCLDIRAKRSAAIALYGLAAHADEDGCFRGTLAMTARVVGVSRSRVTRAIYALRDMGAVEIDGDLANRKNWFTKGPEWEGPNPTITLIIPELRGEDLPEYELKEITGELEWRRAVRHRLKATA